MNKHLLVIGGTKGMGRAFVQKMSQAGYTVSVVGRSGLHPSDKKENVSFWKLDLLDQKNIPKVLDELIAKNGKVDSLIFFQRYRGDGDAWKNEIDVSVTATTEIIGHLADKFNQGKDCSIVVVSSLASYFVAAEQSVSYHAAKAAMNQLVKYYAVKLGTQGIRVNCVSPCAIQKEESKEYYDNHKEITGLYENITPLGRMGNAEDVAKVIAFLCSPDASFITGQNIVMDGGISLQGHEALARRLTIENKKAIENKKETEAQRSKASSASKAEPSAEKESSDKDAGKSAKNAIVNHRSTCRLCESSNIELAIKLEPTPIADRYLPQDRLNLFQECYPLDLSLCKDCGHLQLVDVLDPEILYGDYTYVTSSSLGLVEHFRNLTEALLEKVKPAEGSMVIDIGSNDGSLLKFFKAKGMKVLGVDPAREIARKATQSGVKTIPGYFTKQLAEKIRIEEGPAAIITANNVFAHADNLADITEGVRALLTSEGIFVFEVSYVVHIVERFLFDTVYHEHLSYHSVKPLQNFFQLHGMELIDVEYVPTKGGSLRGTAQIRGGSSRVSERVRQLIEMEEKQGYDTVEKYQNFAEDVQEKKRNLLRMLENITAEGKTIAGYGASHTVTTLIYHLGLGSYLDYIIDDNPQKQNSFSPGFHIPVFSSLALHEKKPDYVVILAWQYADPIMKKNQAYLDQGGQFIIPLPFPKIIKNPAASTIKTE